MSENQLSSGFLQRYPDQAARVLERLPVATVAEYLTTLENTLAAESLVAMVPSFAQQCIGRIELERVGAIISEMAPESAANLLRGIMADDLNHYLQALSESRRRQVMRLLRYPPGSVGSLMKSDLFILPEMLTVGDAIKRIRASPRRLKTLYVTREGQHFVGLVMWDSLLCAPEGTRLAQLVTMAPAVVSLRMPLEEVQMLSAWLDYRYLPVVGSRGVLVGEIAYRDIDQQLSLAQPWQGTVKAEGLPLELIWQGLASLTNVIATLIFPQRQSGRDKR